MKRTFTYALTAVLGVMVASSAIAQDAFPDTPENHWAYEALANMRKAGLLVGYPDGLYRGARPASRYEMAVALYALYQHLSGVANGLESRIKMLEEKQPGEVNLDDIRREIAALRADVNGMKAWGDDIANLKRMASTFEKELASMGVDIEALKKGVSDLNDRVTALEKRKPAVDIHGTVNLHIATGDAEDGFYGITVDGRPVGVSNGDGEPSNFARDLNVFHHGELFFSGTNDEGPKWMASLQIHNFFGSGSIDGFGGGLGLYNLSNTATGVPFSDSNSTDIYFDRFAIMDKTAFLGQTFNYKVGRVGYKVSPYVFQRPDVSPYYWNQSFDNGEWTMDGAVLGFGLGSAMLDIFAGRNSDRLTSNGTDINPMSAGRFGSQFVPGDTDRPRGLEGGEISIDHLLGLNLNLPLGGNGKLNLSYILLDSDSITTLSGSSLQADRVAVFGGEVKFDLGGWMLGAGYSQSNVQLGDSNVVDEDNAAWFGQIGRGTMDDRWSFAVGYRAIDPQFAAPGYWGRIGIWWNPTDIEGFYAKAHFNINDRLGLHLSGGMYEGRDVDLGGGVGLSSDDELSHFNINLRYRVSDSMELNLGTEQVMWDLASRGLGFAGGETDERWYNIGLKYHMNDKAWWNLNWQISDYDADGTAGMNPFSFSGADRAKGSFVTSTLSIRF
jgi:hypothetical protein